MKIVSTTIILRRIFLDPGPGTKVFLCQFPEGELAAELEAELNKEIAFFEGLYLNGGRPTELTTYAEQIKFRVLQRHDPINGGKRQ